jgi:hypothetical protein
MREQLLVAREKLVAGIAGAGIIGAMTVAGQQFTFRSIEDMERALAWIDRQLALLDGTSRTRLAATSKGA